MKNKYIIGIITLLSLFILFTPTVFAGEVNLEISLDNDEIQKGEDVTIVVQFKSPEDMESIDAEISYDSGMLEYLYGGGNSAHLSNGNGGITDILHMGSTNRVYYFTFLALEEGSVNFSVDFSNITSFENGELLGNPVDNLNFTIKNNEEINAENKEIENDQTEEKEEVEKEKEEKSIIPPEIDDDFIEVEYDGITYLIYREFSDNIIPDDFYSDRVSIQDESIKGANHSLLDLKIIYAIKEYGGSQWYVYNENEDTVYPFNSILTNHGYVIMDVHQEVPGYEETQIKIKGETVIVLTNDDLPKNVYLVYALDRKGAPNYYFYDKSEDTLQRAKFTEQEVLSYVDIESDTAGEIRITDFPMWLIYSVNGLILALLVGIVILMNATKRKKEVHKERGANNDN